MPAAIVIAHVPDEMFPMAVSQVPDWESIVLLDEQVTRAVLCFSGLLLVVVSELIVIGVDVV